MCDIWKANTQKREISVEVLDRHLDAIRGLRVQRVMLTGGEPLLHSNLWAFCERLQREGIRLTLITTGLLIEPHARRIAELVDDVVVSIDGPPDTHDSIRRVRGGFNRIARGVAALRARPSPPAIGARCVLQKANYGVVDDTIRAVHAIGVDRVSFLAADVTSTAFNRIEPWPPERQQEIALTGEDLPLYAAAIDRVSASCRDLITSGFLQDGIDGLWRIYHHYAAAAGAGEAPPVRCNAPWVSAVLEPNGTVRPCFFQPAYPSSGADLAAIVNSPGAIQFRRGLDVRRDATCRRCVCTLSLPLTGPA
jgi:MoaA/NifB/PqqE/SkfB family radical SAM enzyme